MTWLIFGVIGIIYLISLFVDSNGKDKHKFDNDRQKYKQRVINSSESLFERNIDIIQEFEDNITSNNSYGRFHYIENETRDCINEICLAENQLDIQPNYKYLSSWRAVAPPEWVELSRQIEETFQNKQDTLQKLENDLRRVRTELKEKRNKHTNPLTIQKIKQYDSANVFFIEDLPRILKPNDISWTETENNLICFDGRYETFPKFSSRMGTESVDILNNDIQEFNKILNEELKEHESNKNYFQNILVGYKKLQKPEFIERINHVINHVALPPSVPKIWEVDFDAEQGIVIVETKLPDVVHSGVYKKIQLKSGTVQKPLNQKEMRDEVPNIHPAIILRIAFEIFKNDVSNTIKLLIVNGWVEFDDPNTGISTKTYTASLAVEKDQLLNINLSRINALSAFTNLKGKSAGKLIDVIPITPIMTLDKSDKRFIDTKDVLNDLGAETNLASMDWQDFENLIAELFTKEFDKEGAEVKVTQASRDRGVDAIVFDPDPIKGGKFVIQAKRYTKTVDVSAVRDLCAVVKKEGASRGILVTTSTYGNDAYTFANNEPVTLLNGAELLGLLKKHGYNFRINLTEARNIQTHHTK